jgi:hypothetical protein
MKRFIIELPDAKSLLVYGTALQTAQTIEDELGLAMLGDVVLGLQAQLGMASASALALKNQADLGTSELLSDLYGLIGTALVLVKALTPNPEIQTNEPAD